MRIYNTLTKQIEEFVPIKSKAVGMYTCGPTVYDLPHIGNLRAYIFADILHRTLEYNGFSVKHVVNITDVGHLVSDEDEGEDKLIKGAKREGRTAFEIANKYTKSFIDSLSKLNIEKADIYPKATEHIKEQISFIEKLEEKGFTYNISDGVYFDTKKLTDYGKLAGLDISGLKAGARIKVNPEKRNITDFALWKFSPKNSKRDMEWDSPWGKGFPGWHIECSAMSTCYLGEYFDIHTGGVDHIPVHHTNEIAQSEAVFGKPFVKYWLHNEFLLVDGRKMSKSLNNFYTLDDLENKYSVDPLAFRMLCLMSHYRDRLNFTDDSITQAQNTLNNLIEFYTRILNSTPNMIGNRLESQTKKAKSDFKTAIDEDLNTPRAIAVLFEYIKEVNILTTEGISDSERKDILGLIRAADMILGLRLESIKPLEPDNNLKELLEERRVAREKEDWDKSDKLRTEIEKFGYEVEDTTNGQRLTKK